MIRQPDALTLVIQALMDASKARGPAGACASDGTEDRRPTQGDDPCPSSPSVTDRATPIAAAIS